MCIICNSEFLSAIEYYKALFQILLSLRKKKKEIPGPGSISSISKKNHFTSGKCLEKVSMCYVKKAESMFRNCKMHGLAIPQQDEITEHGGTRALERFYHIIISLNTNS